MVVQGQKNVDKFTRNQVETFVTKQLTKLRELPINGTKIETESKDTAEMQSAARG
jgi:hypothetical protein